MARVEMIKDAQLELLDVEGNLSSAIPASSLWADQPVLFLVIRRPGCIACRELAHELSQKTEQLAQAYGIGVVAVLKEYIAEDVRGFREYFSGPVYLDQQLSFYKALTGGKLVKHSAVGTLLKPSVWSGIRRAMKKDIQAGSLAGDATVNGGIMIVSKNGIQYQYKEVVAQLPSFDEIVLEMKKVSGSDDKVESETGAVKRLVCTEEVCVRS